MCVGLGEIFCKKGSIYLGCRVHTGYQTDMTGKMHWFGRYAGERGGWAEAEHELDLRGDDNLYVLGWVYHFV